MPRRLYAFGAPLVVLVVLLSALYVLRQRDGGPLPAAGPVHPVRDGSLPQGQAGGWRPVFADEFDGSIVDSTKWTDRSSALADDGHGNKDNQQLEWNRAANCAVAGGELVMTARREPVTSPAGVRYDWTSCLLTSTPALALRYGFVEERAVLPAERGFWPALWTWQAPGVDRPVETDVYEFYSDNHARLHLSQHSGSRSGEPGRCRWKPPFDPTTGWHTYGAAILPSGTTWYVDGAPVCHVAATSDGDTNIITNLAVYAQVPPAADTRSAVKRVDYVRAWTPIT
jgi:beta-glucanase (GH16 family)